MDLANMRYNGVRSLLVSCRSWHVARVLNMDAYDGAHRAIVWPAHGVPSVRCQGCGRAAQLDRAAGSHSAPKVMAHLSRALALAGMGPPLRTLPMR